MEFDYDKGDEVICVDDRRTQPEHAFILNWPKKGKKYTVRDILHNDDIVPGVLLHELHNKVVFIKLLGREQEQAFAPWRFKKIQEISPEERAVLNEINGNTEKVGGYEIGRKAFGVDAPEQLIPST